MKNTLHLNLKKKWFDMILSGHKKEEYRALSSYWVSRLCDNRKGIEDMLSDIEYIPLLDIKRFDTITFSNAYQKNRPQFEIELKEIIIGEGFEEWGAEKGKLYFVLRLGEILSTKNILQNNNENYLQSKIELAKNTWKDIDVDEYLKQVRGDVIL